MVRRVELTRAGTVVPEPRESVLGGGHKRNLWCVCMVHRVAQVVALDAASPCCAVHMFLLVV
jgi:hypothetical protein